MNAMFQLRILGIVFVNFICVISLSSGHFSSPANIETFYPAHAPPPSIPLSDPPKPNSSTQSQQQELLPAASVQPKSPSRHTIAKAVAATAASTLGVAGVVFYMVHRRSSAQQRRDTAGVNGGERAVPPCKASGLGTEPKNIGNDDGLDAKYWRILEGRHLKNSFKKEPREPVSDELVIGKLCGTTELIDEIPPLRDKSSSSQSQVWPMENLERGEASSSTVTDSLKRANSSNEWTFLPPRPPPLPQLPSTQLTVQERKSPVSSQPLTPNVAHTKNLIWTPYKAKNSTPAVKPPPRSPPSEHQGEPGEQSWSGEACVEVNGRVKLKPLHWEKVKINKDHSMVWDNIDNGSFRFDGDLLEALFGCVATGRKSAKGKHNSVNKKGLSLGQSGKIFILDPQKSQNTAIVLRSLAISRNDILDALRYGEGLSLDDLEKLTRIAPTKEEESEVLAFKGDPLKLADAESFLFYLLKAVPSAFSRLKAMLFRLNYNSELLHYKEILRTLELACRELRTRKLFFKLLEAVLKAGNRMNAGTTRGNAQAFNLTALQRLADVKSINGKTTLLDFVVEEVIRAEGKRCVLNRSHMCSSHNSDLFSSNSSSPSSSKEDTENEYIKLGLPAVGGLSTEFPNVKKAATIDCQALSASCSSLATHAKEIRITLAECSDSMDKRFAKAMEHFTRAAEEEMEKVRKEQRGVMELVNRTSKYYQAETWKENEADPLQLFAIVKDFLDMVDRACMSIARNIKKKTGAVVSPKLSSSSSPKSQASSFSISFPNLSTRFQVHKLQNGSSNSSSTNEDF